MVDINPINPQSITVNVPSNGSLTVNNPGGSTAQVSTNADAQLAYSWACGVGLIQGIDYSAKYWAGKAKESELIAVNAIQGVEDAKDDAIAELESAKDTCLNDIELAGDDKVAEIEGLASDYESTLIALTYRAETAATNAEASKTAAAKRASDAAASATNASDSATSAATNANLALGYKNDAYASADFAGQYKTAAEQAKTDAQYYRTQASDYAAQANTSATSASRSASIATQAQTSAEIARDAAQGYAQQAEQAKDDIEAELDNYVQTSRQINGKDLTNDITLTSSDVGALSNTTKYGSSLQLSLDSSTYVLTATLKDQDGNTLGTSQTVDFPVEQLVMDVNWNSTTKAIDITLKNGTTTSIPASEITNGLQPTIDSTNKLSSDLVDDTNSTHKFATAAQLNQIATNTNNISNLATVATSGNYNDLTNKPTIPAAQVQADWDVTDTTSKAYIKNKPYIPSGVVVDQTYDGTSANPQSGVAIAGAGFLQNTATGGNSLSILGTASTKSGSVNIGALSKTTTLGTAIGAGANVKGIKGVAIGQYATCSTNSDSAIAIGCEAKSTADHTIAIGELANANAAYAIQIGRGTNSTAQTLQVSSYTLLDTSTGLIPDARISSNIARTSQITTPTYDSTNERITW